ncbi:MAG: alpha-galactosidase [Armatimonadetes bacterium]|nr:alpha-galactosidase [Armatimonadota bacterium]
MRFPVRSISMAAVAFAVSVPALAAMQADDEMVIARRWAATHFSVQAAQAPFSFTYGGRHSSELFKSWSVEVSSRKLDRSRIGSTITYTDSETGLQARCEAVAYNDYPTVEWTLYFKNTGTTDTPIIEDVQSLDIHLAGKPGEAPILHHHNGDGIAIAFAPLRASLGPGVSKRFASRGGRPTDLCWPYYNVEYAGQGTIVVLGWSGQWATEFVGGRSGGVRVRGGQELTHFKLHPGEEVRAPMVVLQFYKGDWIRGQNIWRRWMRAHNMPRPGGKELRPIREASSSHQYGEMLNANEENQKLFIDRYHEEKLGLDYWWMDIGWYVDPVMNGGWVAGTWEVDMNRFPGGLKAISDHARPKGIKTMVWFEPEHVWPGTKLYERQDWLLQAPNDPAILSAPNQCLPLGRRRLLDMGNPEARRWLADHVSKLIKEQGISIYRQDFNIEPLVFWRNTDAPDRQGIAESKYVRGYLEYWDELVRRKPDLLIDTCSSGGRRDDVETLRRSVPFWRSDTAFDPVTMQCQTYGMAFWLPFFGTGNSMIDTYAFRSNMCPSLVTTWDVRDKNLDYDLLRKLSKQWRQVADNYLGDYYPLTEYSADNNVWMVWQFDRPEVGEGMAQAFRRAECPEDSGLFKLCGLDANARYVVTNLDEPEGSVVPGRELMEKGLRITIKEKPGAAIITIRKESK